MYCRLVENIKNILEQEAASNMVGIQNTGGNPSIDYLPGAFSTIKRNLQKLSSIKKIWSLEIHENSDKYHLKLEDSLSIYIPKKYKHDFNPDIFKVPSSTINLEDVLNEASLTADTATTLHNLKQLTLRLDQDPEVRKMRILINEWRRMFPKTILIDIDKDTSLNLRSLKSDIDIIFEYLYKLYEDEPEKLDILYNTVLIRRPLGTFLPFSRKDYLIGVTGEVQYGDVKLKLILKVDTSWNKLQYLEVDNEDSIGPLNDINSLKVVGNKAFPISGEFKARDFLLIKKVLDT